jgi:ATP-dependent DNA helicase DinG
MIEVKRNSNEIFIDTDEVLRTFSNEGELSTSGKELSFSYELRPQQITMAEAIISALNQKRHIAVEAGTGVGKTFAYLIPFIFALEKCGGKVAISTNTINLQEQILHKDVPFLKKCLKKDFSAVLCKGRQNYVCLRRLERSYSSGKELFNKAEFDEVRKLQVWAEKTEDGSLSEIGLLAMENDEESPQPSHDLWAQVCSEHDNCLGRKCKFFLSCFVMKARAKAYEADILIINHHLLFSDQILKNADSTGFLPVCEYLVLDEAHCIDDVISKHTGIHLTQRTIEYWLKKLFSPESEKGILALLKAGKMVSEIEALWNENATFFEELAEMMPPPAKSIKKIIHKPIEIELALPLKIGNAAKALLELAQEQTDEDIKTELVALSCRGSELKDELISFISHSMEGHVYWMEKEGTSLRLIGLHSAPIDIAPLMQQLIFSKFSSVVMTSATLSVKNSLDYFLKTTGAPSDSIQCLIGSPFNYARQMKVILLSHMPDPSSKDSSFREKIVELLQFFLVEARGRTFVLFTNAELLKSTAAKMEEYLAENGIELIAQNAGLSRHAMLTRFIKNNEINVPSVLFGLDSFWMGVDVRGEALSNVIIVKLPFSVPDDPITEARMKKIEEEGKNGFMEYLLPEAVLKFRQGIGRLIRTTTDTGRIIVLDPRILTKFYGRHFIEVMPDSPVETIDARTLVVKQ